MRIRFLPALCAAAVSLISTTASAGPPPPTPTEMGGDRPGTSPRNAAPPPPPRASSRPSGAGPTTPSDPLVDQRVPTEDLSRTWGYSSGPTEGPNYVSGPSNTELAINPIGYYQGVTLSGDNLPPFAPAELGTAPAVMTWTGFEGEKAGAGSHAFFQLSSAVQHHLVVQPERVTVRLPNTSVNVRNNMRRLDTSFFKTPVSQISISRDGPDTVITLDLRRPATPQVSLRGGSNGYQLLVVQFALEVEGSVPAPAPQS